MPAHACLKNKTKKKKRKIKSQIAAINDQLERTKNTTESKDSKGEKKYRKQK